MLSRLSPGVRVMASLAPASPQEIEQAAALYPELPPDYVELVREATDIEFSALDRYYLRVWGPARIRDMDIGYRIRSRIPGAVPLGDEGHSWTIVLMNGKRGTGLYKVSLSNIDREDAIWLAKSLERLLCQGENLHRLDEDFFEEDVSVDSPAASHLGPRRATPRASTRKTTKKKGPTKKKGRKRSRR